MFPYKPCRSCLHVLPKRRRSKLGSLFTCYIDNILSVNLDTCQQDKTDYLYYFVILSVILLRIFPFLRFCLKFNTQKTLLRRYTHLMSARLSLSGT